MAHHDLLKLVRRGNNPNLNEFTNLKFLNRNNFQKWDNVFTDKKAYAFCAFAVNLNGELEINSYIQPSELVPILETLLLAIKGNRPIIL